MDQAISKIVAGIADDASRLAVADLIAYLKETGALADGAFDEAAYKPRLKAVMAGMVAPPQQPATTTAKGRKTKANDAVQADDMLTKDGYLV